MEPKHHREDLADVVSRMAPILELAERTNKSRIDIARTVIGQVGPRNGRSVETMAQAYWAAAMEMFPRA